MGFRVVDSFSFRFETDLSPSARNIHPSGVLHAFRRPDPPAAAPSTAPTAEPGGSDGGDDGGDDGDGDRDGGEEHVLVWIANSLHIDRALSHLEERGFDRRRDDDCTVFVPYSSRKNWEDRYPQAVPDLECTEDGKVEAIERLGSSSAAAATNDGEEGALDAAAGDAADGDSGRGNDARKRRKSRSRATNMVQDGSCISDAERDELHVEIYKYLSWLHGRLSELEEDEAAAVASEDGEDVATARAAPRRKSGNGVDLAELGGVLGKLESAFAVIPNLGPDIEEEVGDAGSLTPGECQEQQPGEAEPVEPPLQQQQARPEKGAPFLEEALSEALARLVAARETNGKPRRRSRKRKRVPSDNPNRKHSRVAGDFDEIFERLVRFKDEYGHCRVPRSYEDSKLSNWVNGIRHTKSKLRQKGLELEEPPLGKKILAKTLTAERLERLNSIGFAWSVQGPKAAWEDRFRECVEYHEHNGRWPSQSMGKLGEWVHKQRSTYAKKDPNFMKTRVQKLDEVGFEWTPRGYTRMSWDEGFDMLMEYGRINGHYNVPCPGILSEDVDKMSVDHRFFRWVESLHGMYRSYTLGRQSGSLTDERVVLLVKHGFTFRND